MFTKQFIGNRSWQVLLGIFSVHLLAIIVKDSVLALPALLLVGVVVAVIAWRSTLDGLIVAFTELFVGGHGHLIDAQVGGFSVSLRMVIFFAVVGVWGVQFFLQQQKLRLIPFRDLPILVLLLAIVIGVATGMLNNEPMQVLDDANGYATLLYVLPLFSIRWTQTKKRDLLQVLFACAAWLVFLTLLLSFLFTHLDGKTLSHVYTFVRDARIAEITLQTVSTPEGAVHSRIGAYLLGGEGYWYRIFLQSQFYLVVTVLLMFAGLVMMWRKQRAPDLASGTFIGASAALFLSMSRSFAVGLATATVFLVWVGYRHGKETFLPVSKRIVVTALYAVVAFAVAWTTVALPFPETPSIEDAAFYSTSADTNREVAVSSRWALLHPMMEAIYHAPLLGAGFGKEITYTSDDPRIRSVVPDGVITTYRFEWGYQDIWLKMGVPGLIAFAWLFATLVYGVIYTMKHHGHAWIVAGLFGGVIALYTAHAFSPFLNHPIGLGYLLFVLPFLDWEGLVKRRRHVREQKQPAQQRAAVQMKPVVTRE